MVEEQVEEEVLLADLEVDLPTDLGEPGTQLEQELGDVVDERPLDLALLSVLPNTEEVELVGILEYLASEIGRRCWQRLREVGDRRALALAQPGVDVHGEDIP